MRRSARRRAGKEDILPKETGGVGAKAKLLPLLRKNRFGERGALQTETSMEYQVTAHETALPQIRHRREWEDDEGVRAPPRFHLLAKCLRWPDGQLRLAGQRRLPAVVPFFGTKEG